MSWSTRSVRGAAIVVVLAAVGCTTDSDEPRETTTPPPTSEPITLELVFGEEDPCEFFDLDMVRDHISIDQWAENGSPETDGFDDQRYGGCGATLEAVGRGGIPMLVQFQIREEPGESSGRSRSNGPPGHPIFRNIEFRDVGSPWSTGESFVFSEGRSAPSGYEIGVYGFGNGFEVQSLVWNNEQEQSVELCPETDVEAECIIDPYVLRDWLEYEYMPMIHEKITERLER